MLLATPLCGSKLSCSPELTGRLGRARSNGSLVWPQRTAPSIYDIAEEVSGHDHLRRACFLAAPPAPHSGTGAGSGFAGAGWRMWTLYPPPGAA